MHIQFLKQNKAEILNGVEVTARAIPSLSAIIQSPIRSQPAFCKRGLQGLYQRKMFFISLFLLQKDLEISESVSPFWTFQLPPACWSRMLHPLVPVAVSHAATVPSYQLKHWPLRSYKCYFSFNILILMSLEVINSTSFMSLGPCLFAHHLLLM